MRTLAQECANTRAHTRTHLQPAPAKIGMSELSESSAPMRPDRVIDVIALVEADDRVTEGTIVTVMQPVLDLPVVLPPAAR